MPTPTAQGTRSVGDDEIPDDVEDSGTARARQEPAPLPLCVTARTVKLLRGSMR
jgi:hypothetical protein